MPSRSSGRLAAAVTSRIESGSARPTDHVTNAQHSRSAATSASSSRAPSASTRQRISNRCPSRRARGTDFSARACQRRKLRAARTGLQYLLFGTGLGSGQGLESGAFLKSRPDLETPDLQFHFIAALMTDHTRKKADRHGFMAHVCQLRPESRGYISIKSADPLSAPIIQPNYLEAEEDRRALREGVRQAREVFAQKAFDPYRGPELMPGAHIQRDDQIDAWVRKTAETIYHPVGSAKMGRDRDSVVDPSLKVYGIEGLRVVDASVMPALVSGNTNAPTIMIAEKAADMILGHSAPAPEVVRVAEDGQNRAVAAA